MKKQLLIVDGYNMIGTWPQLNSLKKQEHLEDARDQLLHQLSDYSKYEGIEILVVFDAQLVPGIQKSYKKYQLTVVFTKENETADSYIERTAGEKNDRFTQVTVATSDLAEQWIIFSKGALRCSANELYKMVKKSKAKVDQQLKDNYYLDYRRNSPWTTQQLKELKAILENIED